MVSLWFGVVTISQGASQIGYIGPLGAQTWIPHFDFSRIRKVHEYKAQQNIKIAMCIDHNLIDH